MKHIKECKHCSLSFPAHGNGKYCVSCRAIPRYRRDKEMLEEKWSKCAKCGEQLHSATAIYCNHCKPHPIGENHPNWKGGTIGNGTGYRQVYIGRINGKTEYILEHLLVWEKAHNRKLPKGYLIHHLNGIKDDNRIENLAAIPRNKHSVWTLVELAQKRIKELEQLHLNLS